MSVPETTCLIVDVSYRCVVPVAKDEARELIQAKDKHKGKLELFEGGLLVSGKNRDHGD